MSSILRIDASRRNGAKSRGPVTPDGKEKSAANSARSTGPVTPEGKSRVSRNALRHGLASVIVLPDECRGTFEETLAAIKDEFKPRTWSENRTLEIMAADDWRRGRAWSMENVHLSRAADNQDHSDSPAARTALGFGDLTENSKVLKNVHRYEVRNSRDFLRHLHLFESRRRAAARDAREAQSAPQLVSEPRP